ncbi:citrate/2-methylcitrate synthase, partial [uncultured Dubosiella sp.]
MNTLKRIYRENMEANQIDPSLYARYRVKQGLRNENGTGVKVGLTKICDVVGYQMIHGHKHNIDGQLIYRGYSVRDLVKMQSKKPVQGYETVAFLLIFGKLPTDQELALFRQALHDAVNADFIQVEYETSNLLNALQIEILKLYGSDPNPDRDSLEERMSKGISILGSIPLFVFSNYHHKRFDAYPLSDKGLAENILALARQSDAYTIQEARVMDTLLMLHADHGGGNNSTFANVVITSTGTDIYSCMSAAIGSLKGPRHGGAAEKMSGQCEMILELCQNGWDDQMLEEIAYKLLAKELYDKSGLIYG